ncbi:VOC family protein [Nesterenkonia halophila]|uniref:VOC family protein n=1 Tax=Nesterenkonia halophila TaxID=302044 RepID=UPI001292ACB7|nr:VOC family protein [Nesterenkonia halophila]
MPVERIAPMLTVDDVGAAARQHGAVLGMELVMDLGWVAFLADDAGHQLGLMTADASAPVNPDVSVFVDDVDAAHRAAVQAGAEIVHPLTDEEWGVRRFFYRDSSGRVVNVGTHR